jgi:hypothetical protein
VNGKAIWLAAGALEALKGKPTTKSLPAEDSRFRYAIAVSEQRRKTAFSNTSVLYHEPYHQPDGLAASGCRA